MKRITVNKKSFITSLCGTVIGIGFIVRERMAGKKYTYETSDLKNKLVIITGATSGIGKALTREMALRKAKVIMACRDMEACESIAYKLRWGTMNKAIACRELDLASQSSIRNFVDQFSKKHAKLDILINNAGVMAPPRDVTREGIEMQLGVNHMGSFLLTHLLLPHLKQSAPSRIINITSIDYTKGTINKEDLNSVKSYDPVGAYKQSKLANVLFTMELAKRLKDAGVTVNAVYPGVVNSRLMRHTSYYNSYISSIIVKPFAWMLIRNPKQGSQPIVYAAASPELKDVSGMLINPEFSREELKLPDSIDASIQKWMWDVSVKWTKLDQIATVSK